MSGREIPTMPERLLLTARRNPLLAGAAAICLLWNPRPAFAGCKEKPTVQMDERTAESHLLAKKDPVLPSNAPQLVRLEKVVALVTVDRQGVICEVRAVKGPKRLRRIAVKTVKQHWRYRPFLLNWKPVVARFPVTVHFVLPKEERHVTAEASGGCAADKRAAA